MIGYTNWKEGFPDQTHFYAAMRQEDGEWSTGIGKASLRFMCFKPAKEKEIIGNVSGTKLTRHFAKWAKIGILVKNQKICQKSKFWSKIVT